MSENNSGKLEKKGSDASLSKIFRNVKTMEKAPPAGDANETSPAEGKKILTALLISLAILQTLYMNITAYLPTYASKF